MEEEKDEYEWEDGDSSEGENDEIVVDLKADDAPKEQKKNKVKRQIWEKSEKDLALKMHKTHILCLIARFSALNDLINDPTLQALILSILPLSMLRENREPKYWNSEEGIRRLFGFISVKFQISREKRAKKDKSGEHFSAQKIVEGIQTGEVTSLEAVQIFALLCRAMKIKTRLVASIQPIPPKPCENYFFQHKCSILWVELLWQNLGTKQPTEKKSDPFVPNTNVSIETKQNVPAKSKKGPKTKFSSSRRLEIDLLESTSSSEESSDAKNDRKFIFRANKRRRVAKNVEVELGDQWVHVDCLAGKFNDPLSVGESHAKGKKMSYVMAFEESGVIKDVTPRYANEWSRVVRMRGPMHRKRGKEEGWWRDALGQLNFGLSGDNGGNREKEDSSFKRNIRSEPLPTSVSGFRNHPTYCLSKQINQSEVVIPGAASIGVFKGDAIYMRKDISPVKSEFGWKMVGFELLENQKENPVLKKPVSAKKRALSKDPFSCGEGNVPMYGSWQTKPFEPKEAVGGKIPKNEYNSVDLWNGDAKFLPRGTKYLKSALGMSRLPKLCRELGIDYARANVGFSHKNGTVAPVFEGFVVCEEHYPILVSALENVASFELGLENEKRERRVLNRWKRIVRRVFERVRLNEIYGS